MIDKGIILLSTIMVGLFYTRKEIGALIQCVREKDYVGWHDLNRAVARREIGLV